MFTSGIYDALAGLEPTALRSPAEQVAITPPIPKDFHLQTLDSTEA